MIVDSTQYIIVDAIKSGFTAVKTFLSRLQWLIKMIKNKTRCNHFLNDLRHNIQVGDRSVIT